MRGGRKAGVSKPGPEDDWVFGIEQVELGRIGWAAVFADEFHELAVVVGLDAIGRDLTPLRAPLDTLRG
jgi:hypothetical protein